VYIGRIGGESAPVDWLRPQPSFWDFLTKGRTSFTTYYWVNKTNPQGAAAFLAPGQAKPGISFELATEISNPKKVAVSSKAATELLQDIDGMTTFIEQELEYAVMIKVNTELMAGVGSTTSPKGVQKYSVTYTLTTIHTENPNYFDAIRAVVAQLRSGYLQGPITVFINPIDAANMDLTKADTSGVYLLPPFTSPNGKVIGGAAVIEDRNVPVGSFQAGFMQFYRILMYEDFRTAWGWENDDFTKNLVTAIGEMRFHQFVNSLYSDSGAFVYDTFAHVIGLITPPVTP
jgi:HK97 family phage major capsid protein